MTDKLGLNTDRARFAVDGNRSTPQENEHLAIN
jgi:hypothetical protein